MLHAAAAGTYCRVLLQSVCTQHRHGTRAVAWGRQLKAQGNVQVVAQALQGCEPLARSGHSSRVLE